MSKKNFRSDFLIVETFSRQNQDGTYERVEVPDHVRVEYFTRNCGGKWVCERNGDTCSYCRVSEDGMSLICSLTLSRRPIGQGPLLKIVSEITDDASFPATIKVDSIPGLTDVILVEGPSDGSDSVLSHTIMSQLRYGYSAYELAVMNGYVGTLEQWLGDESARVSNEITRQQNEQSRVAAETARVENEQERAARYQQYHEQAESDHEASSAATASATAAATAADEVAAEVQRKMEAGEFDGEDGRDGGLLYPGFSYDPSTGIFTISGHPVEVSRFDYNIDTGILTIKLY